MVSPLHQLFSVSVNAVNNSFEVRRYNIDRQRQLIRAGVELLAHDLNQKIQNYSKGGHRDPNQCYTPRQQAGR